MPHINLHLGVHKTASTYIQSILNTNKNFLYNNLIYSSTPSHLRTVQFEALLNNKANKNINIIEEINIPDTALWIISEENILGVPYDFTRSHEIYPRARNRLLNLASALNGKKIKVFIAIRCYHTFYRSCYLEIIRNKGYFEFKDFYDDERFKKNNWVSLIEMLTQIFTEKNIILWRYEDFVLLEKLLIKKITGLDNISEIIIDRSENKKRASISTKTLEILKEASSTQSLACSQEIIEELNIRHPSNTESQSFMPFTQEEISIFTEQYSDDCNEIIERFPNITFLTPE